MVTLLSAEVDAAIEMWVWPPENRKNVVENLAP